MKRRYFAVGFALIATAAILIWLAMSGSFGQRAFGNPPDGRPPVRLIYGDAVLVDGNMILAWARVHEKHGVKEVGVTIPVAVFDEMPEDGDGPAGAFASLEFPDIVRETTYFNHVEVHSEPHGHPTAPGSANPNRNRVPHFDFHFYAIPEEQVWTIPAVFPPPPMPAVPAKKLPADYLQPGASEPQMGRHSAPSWTFFDPGFLTAVMISGFVPDGSQMHFIEPMVTRELLLERESFELPVPMPEEFGRLMSYPTRFVAEYDADLDVYHFVFSEFVVVD